MINVYVIKKTMYMSKKHRTIFNEEHVGYHKTKQGAINHMHKLLDLKKKEFEEGLVPMLDYEDDIDSGEYFHVRRMLEDKTEFAEETYYINKIELEP